MQKLPPKLTVRVTRNDINKGKRGSARTCAIARAVRRVVGARYRVDVDGDCATVTPRAKSRSRDYLNYNLPKMAQRFITRFDDGRKVNPSTFTCRAW